MGHSKIDKFVDTGESHCCIQSLNYRSPEMFFHEIPSEKIDIWAAGIVFHELLTDKHFTVFEETVSAGNALDRLSTVINTMTNSGHLVLTGLKSYSNYDNFLKYFGYMFCWVSVNLI